MKQAKKLLCMLLVMLLAFSSVSIGVSAAYTSYTTPTSYDIHETPVLSTAQRSSQLLDYVDAMLADADLELVDVQGILTIDFSSVDKALNSIDGIEGAAGFIGMGNDIGRLNFDALGSTRRGTAGKTDLDILYELLNFLNANRGIVGKFLNGSIDLGLIGSFVDLDFNVYTMLMDMLYEAMVDENVETAPSGWTADRILQHAVDVILLGGVAADGDVEEGFLPSMAGKTNINTETIWGIIENAANAATKDILVPFIKTDLGGLIDELKAENPHDAWNLIDISRLNLDSYVWGQYDPTNGIVAELNHLLYIVFDQVWLGEKFWVDGGNDKLEQNLEAALKIVYRELGELILPATSEFLPVEEVNEMNLQQLAAYVAKQFIQSEMPYVLWEDANGEPLPLENIGQVASYVAYSISADFLGINYMEEVLDYGTYDDFGKEVALDIIADIGAYYLNGALPVEIQYAQGVEQLVSVMVNWALQDNNFGGFFKGCGVSASDSAWTKIDKTVFTVLPLHKILGGNASGSYDLIMNKIIGNVFDLNLDGILSLLYKTNYSLLNKTVPQFVVEIVNGVLNVIVARNTQPAMISTSLTSIDAIIQNNNLAGTAERLLNGLYNAGRYQYFWDSLLPILNPLLIDESGYSFNVINPPAGYAIDSLAELQAHVEYWDEVLSEPDVYDTNGANWNESVDYVLWRFDKVESALDDAWDVIDGYNGAVEWLAEAQAAGDAEAIAEAQAELASYTPAKYANAAYEIEYYAAKAAAAQNEANQGHLQYVLYLVESKNYKKRDYDSSVWEVYEKAYDHAVEISEMLPYDEDTYEPSPDLKQSMVNAARNNLLDAMKLLEVKLADMTELEAYYTQVADASTDGYSEETVAAFEEALARAEELLGQVLTADDQDKVDEALADLIAAYEGLSADVVVIVPDLDKKDDGVIVVENLIGGLETMLTPDELLAQYVNSDENGKLDVQTVVAGVVGTGTKLVLKDLEDNVVAEYEVVIFGDANGDGIVDIMDTICLDLYTVYDASANYAKYGAQWTALNLDESDAVDAADAVILDAYTNFEGEIDQQSFYN